MFKYFIYFIYLVFISAFPVHGQNTVEQKTSESSSKKKRKKKKKVRLPNIDLTNWKVTTPSGIGKKPYEVGPPEISNYATNEKLKPFMYNDSTRGALVFHAYPSKATTRNTKYSRSELREQMVPEDNNTNWTFKDGARMKGKLSISQVTKDSDGKYHRIIIMQIHGRLTNEQRDLIGEDDNNAPPMLKIYWDKGKIRVKTKVLKNLNATEEEMLHEDAWGNDDGFNFEQEVGFRKFTLEVKISDGKMLIILNNTEFKSYESIHIKKWNIFENYFKAGNYFQSRDKNAYAKVNYYELEVEH